MKAIKLLLTLALVLSLAGISFAQAPLGPTEHLNVAQMGMGGLTTTVSTNAHTVLYNPGMLTRQHFALEMTVPIGADLTVLDMSNFISDHQNDFASFDSLTTEEQSQFIQDSQEFDNKWFGLNFGPFFGLSFKNFGIAGYGSINPDLKMDQGVLVPAIGLRGYVDAVGAVGFGKTFTVMDREIGFGIAGRFSQRSELQAHRISASDAGSTDLLQTLADDASDPISGLGIDLGAVHTIELGEPGSDNVLDVAAVIQDLYGKMGDVSLKPNLKLGAMYHMPFAGNALVRRWDFGVDLNDMFNREGVSFFQRINMGTELNILAGLISLRGGFHQGYPTYGAGIRLSIIKLDVASYTIEQGKYPGADPKELLMGQLSIGW